MKKPEAVVGCLVLHLVKGVLQTTKTIQTITNPLGYPTKLEGDDHKHFGHRTWRNQVSSD